ncbi:hypothetical protein [Nonomuraea sp. NPDC049400]|uniref:hypothetical protein n=1 Tax=Nonomuraea sp. NPDC049400 TaxID=3364352 RepID=UPI0037A902BF
MTNRGRSSALPPLRQLGIGIALAAIGVLILAFVLGGTRPQQQRLLLVDARGENPRSMAAPAAIETIDPAVVDGTIMLVDNLQLWSSCLEKKDAPVCRAVAPFAKKVWFYSDPQADRVLRMLSPPVDPGSLSQPGEPVALVHVGPQEGASALPGLLAGAAATVLGFTGALIAAAAARRMRRQASAESADADEREYASGAHARPSGSYPPYRSHPGTASDQAFRDRSGTDPARRDPSGTDRARRERPGTTADSARREGSGTTADAARRERPGTTADPARRVLRHLCDSSTP